MKLFLHSLLAVFFCMEIVASLQCYTCDSQTSIDQCMNIINCSSSYPYCKNTVDTSGKGTSNRVSVITKECASDCTSKKYDVIIAEYSISCCKTNLCNSVRGAPTVKNAHLALALSVWFIGALLRFGL
ncbi:prostate stem cell antigen-like [Rhinatrema bivittatum]|uniref:prostate stem cell antigen-like n=1 Tax=Rhinatrema bivittatum TaxID=194408 RepID=UPI001128B973|nr:prostate stem cell antigen-like [Rhinatrema bivittatum]